MSPPGSGSVTIPGRLVRFLRSGVKQELGASLEILAIEVGKDIDPETYYGALARFDAARTLLDAIGVADEPEQLDVELDLARWPRLVLKALESQHDAELIRLEQGHAGEFDLPTRDIPALGCLVADIRKQVAPLRTRTK
ncbi:MAG: hypothetical protein ACLQBY_18315 [Solirubrobacteraceae bacterium]